MPRLAIAKDFLSGYSKLEKKVQTAVESAMDKFAEHTHAGLHLEKIHNSRDSRIRTIRIDAFWRNATHRKLILVSGCVAPCCSGWWPA